MYFIIIAKRSRRSGSTTTNTYSIDDDGVSNISGIDQHNIGSSSPVNDYFSNQYNNECISTKYGAGNSNSVGLTSSQKSDLNAIVEKSQQAQQFTVTDNSMQSSAVLLSSYGNNWKTPQSGWGWFVTIDDQQNK